VRGLFEYMGDSSCGGAACWVELAQYDSANDIPVPPMEIVPPAGTRLLEVDVKLVQGNQGSCSSTPGEFKFGFKIDEFTMDYHQNNRPPNNDAAQIAEGLLDWIHDLQFGWYTGSFTAMFDCAPESDCDEEFWNEVEAGIQDALGEGNILENEQVFDLVYTAATNSLSDPTVSPALVAYGMAISAQNSRMGHSMQENGLIDNAVAWSTFEQDPQPRGPRAGEAIHFVATIDFTKPPKATRPWVGSRSGVSLPGAMATLERTYPGYREPTQEELGSREGRMGYLAARAKDKKAYLSKRTFQVARENLDGLIEILETDNGSNPAAAARVAKLKSKLELSKRHLKQGTAASCDSADDCFAGNCLNGFCCDSACDGPCQSCSLPGLEGLCTPVPNDTMCPDTDLCNGTGTCFDGVCIPADDLDCNDSNACSVESCDSSSGCQYEYLADESPCGIGACGPMHCLSGTCQAANDSYCDDGNPCTVESCSLEEGCLHEQLADGSACSDSRICQDGNCVAGTGEVADSGCACATGSGRKANFLMFLLLVWAIIRTRSRSETT
jgi:hypothetical protein